MPQPGRLSRRNRHAHRRNLRSLRAALAMLALGMAVLVLLRALDRVHWFNLRPASGTAAAMWHAGAGAGTH